MRITQSELGISIDQTGSIISFLTSYFESPDNIKTSTIPFSTDSNFEKLLASCIPATPEELQSLETTYKGSYRSLIGTLLHFSNNTRHDIMYAISRLSCYNAAPNRVAFQGIKKIIRYLALKPHIPIFYPRHKLSDSNTVMFAFSPHQKEHFTYPNHLAVHADAGMPQVLHCSASPSLHKPRKLPMSPLTPPTLNFEPPIKPSRKLRPSAPSSPPWTSHSNNRSPYIKIIGENPLEPIFL